MTWGLGLPLTFSHEALLNFKETSRPTYVTLVGNSEGFGQQRVKVQTGHHGVKYLLHFVAFFHVASLFSTGVDNEKVGVDNEKALELRNSTVFHRGRQ